MVGEKSDFNSENGKSIFWHSAAHVLGLSIEQVLGPFNPFLCDGPSLKEGGFFYEFYLPERKTVSEGDIPRIQKAFKKIVKKNYRFERIEVSRQRALDAFKHNPFKLDILQAIPGYTCLFGEFVAF